ncbi:hypothetical protein WN48_09211 [Eufriesea mexicana]|uniref:Uncharacterized protein n=1 Tax=Eufriesea mexicana TaxID=516756 RepID=A0A310SJZ8_9HYME|nr:hypothetical protein WN48_09211 [Eufriesea mexicana]
MFEEDLRRLENVHEPRGYKVVTVHSETCQCWFLYTSVELKALIVPMSPLISVEVHFKKQTT